MTNLNRYGLDVVYRGTQQSLLGDGRLDEEIVGWSRSAVWALAGWLAGNLAILWRSADLQTRVPPSRISKVTERRRSKF